MAITAILELTLKPDLVDASAQVEAILSQTRAFEGCLGVEVLEDLANPDHLVVLEQWESLDHDLAYRAWRTTEEGASNLGALLAARPVLTKYSRR